MPILNLHDKPFDHNTVAKLDLFEKYCETWLPTFIHNTVQSVTICDFFAGPGMDECSLPGSPLRILDVISRYKDDILKKGLEVSIIFNDNDFKKYQSLIYCLPSNLEADLILKGLLQVLVRNKNFEELFGRLKPKIRNGYNLLIFDQNGLKYFTKDRLIELAQDFPHTDFMFFCATSYLRFPENQKYIPGVDFYDIPPHLKHEKFCEHCRTLVPPASGLKIYPFTLKKDTNIYGVIFGSHSMLGVEKFLSVAWNLDPVNGSANFDINEDWKSIQMSLFAEDRHKRKLDRFNEDLIELLVKSYQLTNADIYEFTLAKGFLPKHAKELLLELKKEKRVDFPARSPYIGWRQIYKEKKIIPIKVLP